MFALILFFLFGILLGVVTGLIPGLHPNTLIFLLLPFYTKLTPMSFLTFIVGLSVSNTVLDFIPSIFIGVPDSDTALSVLPGHRMALQGLGYHALKLTIFGAFISTTAALIFLALTSFIIPQAYTFLSAHMAIILLAILALILFKEQKKLLSLAIFLLSGFLGIITLNSSLANSTFILFPLLAGFFATASLLIASSSGQKLQYKHTTIHPASTLKGGLIGFMAGLFVGFIPGIGNSQSALLFGKAFRMNTSDFLVALGGINTSGITISFIALYLISRARSGAAVALQNIFPTISLFTLLTAVGLTLVALGISAAICLFLGRTAAKLVANINLGRINKAVLLLLLLASFVFNGFFGVLVFLTASSIGMLAVKIGVRRSFCMGVLLLPTIIFYLGLSNLLI